LSGGDSLLHVSVCCKSLASQALMKWSKDVQISGPLLVGALFAISRHAVSQMLHTTHHLMLNSVLPLVGSSLSFIMSTNMYGHNQHTLSEQSYWMAKCFDPKLLSSSGCNTRM